MSDREDDIEDDIEEVKKRISAARIELKAARGLLERLVWVIDEPKCPHKEKPKPGDMFLTGGRGPKLWMEDMKEFHSSGIALCHKDTKYTGNIKDKVHLLLLDEDKLARALEHVVLNPGGGHSSGTDVRVFLNYLKKNQ